MELCQEVNKRLGFNKRVHPGNLPRKEQPSIDVY